MHSSPSTLHTISFAAARDKLAAGQFDHLWSARRRDVIATTVDAFPAVHAAIIGNSSPMLIPCSLAEIDRLFARHLAARRAPPGCGFSSFAAFWRWHADLRAFVTVVNARPPRLPGARAKKLAPHQSSASQSEAREMLHFISALRTA